MKVNSEEKDSSNKGFNGQNSSVEDDYSLMQKSNDGGMLSLKE